MIFVFYALAALLVWLSAKSFVSGLAYSRYFKKELARSAAAFTPFVSVVVPCRGVDDGLAENLLAIVEQEYPEYEVIFVVDNINDPAVGAIEEVSRKDAKTAKKTKLVIASRADGCGQKVENLCEGVLHASDSSQIFVFADSDARPSKEWLRHLVAPLEDESVGAATGYRWFISQMPTFASEMRSVWNASVASALGPNTKSNFCWGGSTAIRRETFERLDVREKWRGTLSDDFALTQTLKDAGLPVIFVPQALTATVEDCTMRELLEFTTRQMKITRVYAGALWLMSLFGTGLYLVVMAAAFLIVILSRQNDLAVWISLAVMALVAFFSTGKAWLRLNAVKLVLTQYRTELERQFWTQNTLWLLSPVLFFYNSIAALLSRRLTWRGITYELKSPRETVIIRD
jgi:ceramide glucosyltransferase